MVKRTFAQVVTLLLAAVLTIVLVVVWMRVVHDLTVLPRASPPIGQPQAVVWDHHVFTSDRQLKRFLTARGLSYTAWVTKHPSAFAVVKHKLGTAGAGAKRHHRGHTRA